MKGGQPLHVLQEAAQKRWIKQPVCLVCGKSVEGYYARFGESGVCSRACMKVQDGKPKYGEHSE